MTARTPLFEEHKALGARIIPFAGWEMPVQYEGLVKEHQAVRNRAGLFDVSHMGELSIEGTQAEAFIDSLVTADLTQLPPGKAVYCVACNEQGTILDDLIVYRRAPDRFMIVCNASNREKIAGHFARHAPRFDVRFEDISDATSLIALQGPKAIEVMRAAGASDSLTGLASFHLAEGTVGGIPLLAARTGYTAEDGFELFVANEHAVALWRALLEAGRPLGAAPCGLGARDTLRLEGRLSLYGNEIDESTNPLEAGLGWVTKLDKPREFLGKSALHEIRNRGLTRKLVGLEMIGRGIARHGYPLSRWSGENEVGEEIGVVTSGSPAPSLDKNIALGYLPANLATVGTKVAVIVRGKPVEAVVVKTPFYKRARA